MPTSPQGVGARRSSEGSGLLVVLAGGVAAALGFLATNATSAAYGDRAAALAAGGLLAMLTIPLPERMRTIAAALELSSRVPEAGRSARPSPRPEPHPWQRTRMMLE